MEVVEKVKAVADLTPALLQALLRRSLASPGLTVVGVKDPEELSEIKTNYGSDLRKLEVTVEEEGVTRQLHLVAKTALQSWITIANVWFNWFIFYRESFWFTVALPELSKLVSDKQASALAEVMPKVFLAYCNYQEDDMAKCFITKPKEKGVILMENLSKGEDTFIDMKDIEKTRRGGVKTAHMRMLLEGLAHFHGAWIVWLRRGGDLGNRTKQQVMDFFQQQSFYQYKWLWKMTIKKAMKNYLKLAEFKKEQNIKEKLEAFCTSPQSVERLMKAFDYKDSKFKTVCHTDFHSNQIMYSLNEHGSPKRVKILDFQALTLGHPAMDIWTMVYSATDPEYRAAHLEADLRAYFTVLSSYMEAAAPDFIQFMQELEERRVYGMVLFSMSCFASLSPTQLPSPTTETSKYVKACRDILLAEEKEDDHPDIREIRRRVEANMREMVDRGHI